MHQANPYHAYRKATHTVSKTRQVVMLYEGVLRNLQQARQAMEEKNISERYNKLVKASEIIIGLQMSLDFDSGEESAQALYDFYSSLDARIMQLHRSQDLELCDTIIAEVRSMHEIWEKIDRGELVDSAPQAPQAEAAPAQEPNTKPEGAAENTANTAGDTLQQPASITEGVTFSA